MAAEPDSSGCTEKTYKGEHIDAVKEFLKKHTLKSLTLIFAVVMIGYAGGVNAYAGGLIRTELAIRDRDAVNENCLSCHEDEIEEIHGDVMGADRNCMKCHSDVTHGMLRSGR